jgi:hypothetical protein
MPLFEITLLLLAIAVVLMQVARHLRVPYPAGSAKPPTEYDDLRLLALAAERKVLHEWRWKGRILDNVYHLLEDELDRAELQAVSVGTTWLEG